MTELHCRLDGIDLGDTPLDMSVRVLLETVTGNTYPDYGWYHPVYRDPRLNKKAKRRN